MKILIINGPNLNLLGKRQPEIYGTVTFEDFLKDLRKQFPSIKINYYQTNHEGSIIDKLQEAENEEYMGIILNPAAYTHTSIAIADTILAMKTPIVEVHISDISKREGFRQISYIADYVTARIMGKGLDGYKEAVQYLLDITD
jgi:3-dehydroquinate dehydratase-2